MQEFFFNRKELLSILSKFQKLGFSRSVLPILECIKIDSDSIEYTNLEIAMKWQFKEKIDIDKPICISLQELTNILSRIKDIEVLFTVDRKDKITISAGSTSISTRITPIDDFPVMKDTASGDTITSLKLSAQQIANAMNLSTLVINPEENRKFLRGALLSIENDKLNIIATDAKRLFISNCDIIEKINIASIDNIIIPFNAVKLIGNIAKTCNTDIYVTYSDTMCFFKINEDNGTLSIATKLIEGQFPDYKQVVPSNFSTQIQTDINDFCYAIDITGAVLKDMSSNIALLFANDKLTVEANEIETTSNAKHTIPILFTQGNKDAFKNKPIEFNLRYIVNPLKPMSGIKTKDDVKLIINANDRYSAMFFEYDNKYKYLIMPIRKS